MDQIQARACASFSPNLGRWLGVLEIQADGGEVHDLLLRDDFEAATFWSEEDALAAVAVHARVNRGLAVPS